jgi:hypothetical protein
MSRLLLTTTSLGSLTKTVMRIAGYDLKKLGFVVAVTVSVVLAAWFDRASFR